MAVEVCINNKNLFKKKLNFKDILLNDMRYGIIDDAFRLEEGRTGAWTVIFNSNKICRGYEVSIDKDCIKLRMPLPTSRSDIEYFYEYIKFLCKKMNAKKFTRDEEEISFDIIERCIELDVEASNNALIKMKQELEEGKYSSLYTFGAICPIALGKRELNVINGDCEEFGELLNELQKIDAYYAKGSIYQKENGEYFGIYVLTEDVNSIFPNKPKILMSEEKYKVDEWYVGFVIDQESKGFIPYNDFLESIKTNKLFDAEHFIITLDSNKMNELLKKYKVDL